MLWQLHVEFPSGHKRMIAQREISTIAEMHEFTHDTAKKVPRLPRGAKWMACNEQSPDFIWAVEKQQNQGGEG